MPNFLHTFRVVLGVILDYLGLKWAFRVVLGVILDYLGLKWAITILRVNGCEGLVINIVTHTFVGVLAPSAACMWESRCISQ